MNPLIKIANVLIKVSEVNNELTESEKQILDILRDERIVRKNIHTQVYSLMPLYQSNHDFFNIERLAQEHRTKHPVICGGVHDKDDGSFGKIR